MNWPVSALAVALSVLPLAWSLDTLTLALAGLGTVAALIARRPVFVTVVAAITIGQATHTRPNIADIIALAVLLALLLAAADIVETGGTTSAIGAHFAPTTAGIVGAAVLVAIGRLPVPHYWVAGVIALCGIVTAGLVMYLAALTARQ
jgi:hypothetical protein